MYLFIIRTEEDSVIRNVDFSLIFKFIIFIFEPPIYVNKLFDL